MMNNLLLNIRPKPQNKPYITLAYFGRILMPNHWNTTVAWHEIQCLSHLDKSFTKSNDSILTYVKWLNGTWHHPLSVKLHLRDKRTKRHNGHPDKPTDTMGIFIPPKQMKQTFPSYSLSFSIPLSTPPPFSHPHPPSSYILLFSLLSHFPPLPP